MIITYILLTVCCTICLADVFLEYKKYERYKNYRERKEQQDAAIQSLADAKTKAKNTTT